MGAIPLAIVDTIVGATRVAREALRGMRDACGLYDVALAGGHLTAARRPAGAVGLRAGPGAGRAVDHATSPPGQSLIVAACTEGTMRTDFPFFRSFDERGERLAGDVRYFASLAAAGACVAAKDVSMAGLVGSLAMLLECSRLGVTRRPGRDFPVPAGVTMRDWLTCFPASRSCSARRRPGGRLPPGAFTGAGTRGRGRRRRSTPPASWRCAREAATAPLVIDLAPSAVTGLSR